MKMTQVRSEIWVHALLRRALVAGVMGGVLRSGDKDAGIILLRVARMDGTADFYSPARDMDGERIWTRPLGKNPIPEPKIDDYCQRRLADDPDLWVVELEDPKGRHFLTEPVEHID